MTYNKLKKVPNIFSAKSKYVMKSVDFSYNEIDGFEGEEEGKYKGLRVETFSLAANPGLTKFPKCLGTTNSLVSYIILRGCSIDEIPEGSFSGKNSTALARPDLQQTEDPVQGFHGRAAALPLRAGYFVQLVRQVPVRAAQLRRADRIRHPRPARCRG